MPVATVWGCQFSSQRRTKVVQSDKLLALPRRFKSSGLVNIATHPNLALAVPPPRAHIQLTKLSSALEREIVQGVRVFLQRERRDLFNAHIVLAI